MDPLLSEAENTADIIDPPTAAEVEAAITSDVRNILTVVSVLFADQVLRKLTTTGESGEKIQGFDGRQASSSDVVYPWRLW